MTALAMTPKGVRTPSLSDFIEEWLGNDLLSTRGYKVPSTNIIETDDHYLLEMAVPGLCKEDFKLTVEDDRLIIESTTTESSESDTPQYRLREFSRQSFSRSFTLADTIDSDSINAKCTDGVLSIMLPKKESAKKQPPKLISID